MANVSVQVGMEVLGADHEQVGKVKETFATDFLLDCRLQTDCYVPYTAVGEARANTVILHVPRYEVNQQGCCRSRTRLRSSEPR
jgi:ribosomal 30S subunit maturation factor RimM